MGHAPAVSVVIPAYNAADFIEETLDSVFAQTYTDFEVVVVDDGSTDDTDHVVTRYDAPLRYIRKENGGSASARNRGIKEARGSFIAFLDADDRWHPRKLEMQMHKHELEWARPWSYTDVQLVDGQSDTVIYRKGAIRAHPEGDVLKPLLTGNFVVMSSTIVRKEIFDEVGDFDESVLHRISEDWDMWLRIAERHPISYIDAPLVNMRHHTERKTETMDLEHALESRLAIIEKAVQRNPARLADVHDAARADLYVNIGRKWMNREERGRARQLFVRAVRLVPFHAEAWMYGLASFLSRRLLRMLGRIRRMGWRIEPS